MTVVSGGWEFRGVGARKLESFPRQWGQCVFDDMTCEDFGGNSYQCFN